MPPDRCPDAPNRPDDMDADLLKLDAECRYVADLKVKALGVPREDKGCPRCQTPYLCFIFGCWPG